MILPLPASNYSPAFSGEVASPQGQETAGAAPFVEGEASAFARLLAELAPPAQRDFVPAESERLVEDLLPERVDEEPPDADVSALLVPGAPLPGLAAESVREAPRIAEDVPSSDTEPGNEVDEESLPVAPNELIGAETIEAESLAPASLPLAVAAQPVAQTIAPPPRRSSVGDRADSARPERAEQVGLLRPTGEESVLRSAVVADPTRPVDEFKLSPRSALLTASDSEPISEAPDEASPHRETARLDTPAAPAAVPVADPNAGPSANALAVPLGVAAPSALSTVAMAASVSANPEPPAQAAAVQAISQRVEVLASQGGGVARIRLHPPELGQVELSVRVNGNAVEISIRVEDRAVQAMAHGARDRLVESLAARDLQIQNFEVESFDARSSGSGARDGAAWMGERRHPGQGDPNGLSGRAETGAESIDHPELRRAASAGVRVVDLRV